MYPWSGARCSPARAPPWRARATAARSSCDFRSLLQQQFPQQAAVAAFLVLAVAADGEIRVLRKAREELEHLPGDRLPHLAPVVPGEFRPALVGPGLGQPPAHQRLARRE